MADRDKTFNRIIFLDRWAGAYIDVSRCSVDGDDVALADQMADISILLGDHSFMFACVHVQAGCTHHRTVVAVLDPVDRDGGM